MVDALAGLDLVAVDVNTVSPPHDANGITAMLAARVMLGFMRVILDSKRTRTTSV